MVGLALAILCFSGPLPGGELDLGGGLEGAVNEDVSGHYQTVGKTLLKGTRFMAEAIANYDPNLVCETGESFYSVTKIRGKAVDAICTQGPNIGREVCVKSNDKGEWSSGCGIAAFHKRSMEEALHFSCCF